MLASLLASIAFLAPSGKASNASSSNCPESGQVELSVAAPSLEGTISRLSMSWFNVEQDGTSPIFFTATLKNNLATEAKVRLLVGIQVTPTDSRLTAKYCTGGTCWAEKEVTWPITVPAGGIKVLNSNTLYSTSFEPGGIDPSNSPFRNLINGIGRLPQGQVKMQFALLCAKNSSAGKIKSSDLSSLASFDGFGAPVVISTDYRPVNGVNLLQPGAPGEFPDIFTSSPTFNFQSDLASSANFDYKGEPRFLLELWQLKHGESFAQCLQRRPEQSTTLDQPTAAFPANWAPLQTGERYVWRVRARERGPIASWIDAEAFGFRLAPLSSVTDPDWMNGKNLTEDQKRLLRLLARILGSRAETLITLSQDGTPTVASLRQDGTPMTLEALEELARAFEEGKNTVTDEGTR